MPGQILCKHWFSFLYNISSPTHTGAFPVVSSSSADVIYISSPGYPAVIKTMPRSQYCNVQNLTWNVSPVMTPAMLRLPPSPGWATRLGQSWYLRFYCKYRPGHFKQTDITGCTSSTVNYTLEFLVNNPAIMLQVSRDMKTEKCLHSLQSHNTWEIWESQFGSNFQNIHHKLWACVFVIEVTI